MMIDGDGLLSVEGHSSELSDCSSLFLCSRVFDRNMCSVQVL